MNKKVYFLLILILLLAGALRFFYLDRIPSGLLPEEISNGWNAYSVLRTGKDEWGNFLPFIFRESGGYKLPFASYMIIPSEAIIGLNPLAVRLPTASAGTLAVFFTYLVTYKLMKKRKIAFYAAYLLAISPWHISFSRYGMEVNWGILLFLAGLYFFLKARDKSFFLIAAGIFFGMSYFTYYNYVVFTLLMVVSLLFLQRNTLFNTKNRKITLFFILLQVLSLSPYIINNQLSKRYNQVSFVSDIGIINRINEHRQACLQISPPVVCKILYNQPIFFAIDKIRNYINHFSSTTFFLYGSQLGLSSMPERWGLFYLFEFPLLIIGSVTLIKKRVFPKILIFWLLTYAIPSSAASEGHIWRMATLLPLPQIIAAVGLIKLASFSKNIFMKIGIVGIICFSFLLLLGDYFIYFPFAQGAYSYSGFKDLYQYLRKIESNYDNIVIAPTSLGLDQLYIYYLFYNQYNPQFYQKGQDINRIISREGWVYVEKIGKWYFVNNLEKVKFPLTSKTLFITDGSFKEDKMQLPTDLKPHLLNTIYYLNGNVAFKVIRFD